MQEPLRYLAARDIRNSPPTFGHLVETADGQPLGRLAGFLMDPLSRQLRYIVVQYRAGWRLRRRLVPFVPARLDAPGRRLQLLVPIDPPP